MALKPITRQEQIIAGKNLEPITRMERFLKECGGSSGNVQTDWNQNDETQPDFIKNKPFYDTEIVVLEEQEVPYSENEQAYFTYVTGEISEGDPLKVVYDGTTYYTEASIFNGIIAFGNMSIVGGEADTGEPFIGVYQSPNILIIMPAEMTATSKIIGISAFTAKKINSRYLPGTKLLYTDGVYVYRSNGLVDGSPDSSERITKAELYSAVLSGQNVTLCSFDGLACYSPFGYDFHNKYATITYTTAIGDGGTPFISLLRTAEYTPKT